MKVYFLEIIGKVEYCQYEDMVVVASTSKEARKIAIENCRDEGSIWGNAKLTTCNAISLKGKAKFITGNYWND